MEFLFSSKLNTLRNLHISIFFILYKKMVFNWANNYPDIQKMCLRFQLFELSNPKRFLYTPLKSIIQEGPQCGLVALAMCTSEPSKEMVQRIYLDAKSNNFTYNGEMFSVPDMLKLAKNYLPNHIELYDGVLYTENIIQFLFNGGKILVPYDSDKNHTPCNLKGHKAHWAVLSGIIETSDNIFVFAKHGKSRNLAVWELSALSDSNTQLTEFSPDRKLTDVEYKLPDDGLSGSLGLQNKSVLLYPLNST